MQSNKDGAEAKKAATVSGRPASRYTSKAGATGTTAADTKKFESIPEQIGDESSDILDEFELDDSQPDVNAQAMKEKILKDREDKRIAKEFSVNKAKGGRGLADPALDNEEMTEENIPKATKELNDLWERVRQFFNNQMLNEKGDLDEVKEFSDGTNVRTRFEQTCRSLPKNAQGDILHFREVLQAFNSCYIKPVPTEDQYKRLFRALEVYFNEENQLIQWRKILEAPHSREQMSIGGIFPKIKPKGPSAIETENNRKKLEEETKLREKMEAEDAAKKKLAEDQLKALQKQQQQRSSSPIKADSAAAKKLQRDQKIAREKQEAIEKEEQKREKDKIAAKEKIVVQQLGSDFRKRLGQIMNAFDHVTPEVAKNQFQMFDANKNNTLSLKEFVKAMQEMKIKINPNEIIFLFEFIDEDNSDSISYTEFIDVVKGFRTIDVEKTIRAKRARLGLDQGIDHQEIMNNNYKSMEGSIDKRERNSAGTAPGLSEIMQKSEAKQRERPKLVDDSEFNENLIEIKESFLTKAHSFVDLLSLMGKARDDQKAQVMLGDFEKCVQALCGPTLFSAYQIKFVFKNFAEGVKEGGADLQRAFIPVKLFKDIFYPTRTWKPNYNSQANDIGLPKQANKKAISEVSETDASIHIDMITMGRTPEEILAEKQEQMKKEMLADAMMSHNQRNVLEDFEGSEASMRIDNIAKISSDDPRIKKDDKLNKGKQKKEGGKKAEEFKLEPTTNKSNPNYYRQNEVVRNLLKIKEFDSAVSDALENMIKKLIDELETPGGVPHNPESFVDRYGKEFPGYLTRNEFKDMYLAHVYYNDDKPGYKQPLDENMITALFNMIDSNQRQKVSKIDLKVLLTAKKPASNFFERLKHKLLRGNNRFGEVLRSELLEADIPFGCQGIVPLPIFQSICADYDLALERNDLELLKEENMYFVDQDRCNFVRWREILARVMPKETALNMEHAEKHIICIQRMFRGFKGRQYAEYIRKNKEMVSKLKAQQTALAKGQKKPKEEEKKGSKSSERKGALNANKAQQKEERDRKAAEQGRQQRATRKTQNSLETKMAGTMKAPRDPRANEKAQKSKQALDDFMSNDILDKILVKAICYGDSLHVCKDIQKNFETRPVTKFVFPLLQQFQFAATGVSPKSLQSMNSLGQIMFLNSENQLNQFDIATTKALQEVNMGTRPPLKHYDIIDMVCDQRSGRIYTLNANWILEIWNIEQNASFPQKRIAVCTNEGGKDFISHYYKHTYYGSKPRFLSLNDSNQQILVVNTSCVDGSIVFIDPISFSVLKKIQLRYQDYEIPLKIRHSVKKLRQIFEEIKCKHGKDLATIFRDLTNLETEEIEIEKLILKLCKINESLDPDHLREICAVLDEDVDGRISLDEFHNLFTIVAEEEDEFVKAQEDQMLQDEVWPKWVIHENLMQEVQTLLHQMFTTLEKNYGITAEQAFGSRDVRETGVCSKEEFLRVLEIFFSESLRKDAGDYALILRLTETTQENSINYRHFCRFLERRLVRSFKHVVVINKEALDEDEGSKKTPLELELEQPIVKENRLSYILKKAAQLDIDLRKEFIKNDPLELSVIPRVSFWRILIELPLGLEDHELDEVFDNDMNFDNYGNVDYTLIINSDLFVALERRRLQQRNLNNPRKPRKTVRHEDAGSAKQPPKESNLALADNRKVVVEDLIFIDDLEIIIYTTVLPKTSTVFVTSLSKHKDKNTEALDANDVRVIDLKELQDSNIAQLQQKFAESAQQSKKDEEMLTNHYQLIARLRGHKNQDPPSICYIANSGCLISGEKYLRGDPLQKNSAQASKADNPSVAPTVPAQKQDKSTYEKQAQSRQNNNEKCEILIFNLQRDMIELFSLSPPWNIPYHKKFVAHDASIIDIAYLSKAQLLVTASADQTIRFWDPVSQAYELTDPGNNPHAQFKPGYYKPLKTEQTKSNETFKEVKRVYTGNDSSCYALRCLQINNVILNPSNPDLKSQIEWLVCLKLSRPSVAFSQQARATQTGFVCGYGIERVKIEIPALHHDDIVPPYVMKECEELIEQRRRKIVTAFQHMLPVQIEKMYAQVQLQNSYMDKIRQLFMKAILNRKDEKFVNPEPLREIYNIILKLPTRTKFESFLASSGCSDKLSVSETFFYLQKFMQIHPLRTTQIEFEKSIEDFYARHQRQFLRGVKRWPKQSIQKFANYIRLHGLNVSFLQEPSSEVYNPHKAKVLATFCTRERFALYFSEHVEKDPSFQFSDEEIDQILTEMDPFHTGVIQIALVQRYFSEEIGYQRQVSLKKPQEVIEMIRTAAFPSKRIALQQSLAAADVSGDGYIEKTQFIDAVYRAGLNSLNRDNLEFLFDVYSERFETPDEAEEQAAAFKHQDSLVPVKKYLFLPFFVKKLFQNSAELREVSEVDQTLQQIKAALIYKGVDFAVIFAEQPEEDQTKGRSRSRSRSATLKKKEQSLDVTSHYNRFSQQLTKADFIERVMQLKAQGASADKVNRLANFLSLNQKNQTIIYLNAWLHHLQRVATAFHNPDKEVLAMICSKLLRNEAVFRSYLDTIGMLKSKREEEKFISQADLRSVLAKFNVNYINQGLFLERITKGGAEHVEDIIQRMQQEKNQRYMNDKDPGELKDIRDTDWFDVLAKKIRENEHRIKIEDLQAKMESFDPACTGYMKVFALVNTLKYNLPSVFDDHTCIGLQYQLETLSYEQTVSIDEFCTIFFRDVFTGRKGGAAADLKVQKTRNAYSSQDYDDLLGKISEHLQTNRIDLSRIMEIFAKQTGNISYQNLEKIFELVEYPIKQDDERFSLFKLFADENNVGSFHAYDLASQIQYADQVSPQFSIARWLFASRDLNGRVQVLEKIRVRIEQLKDALNQEYGDGQNFKSGVLTGDQFQTLFRNEMPELTAHDLDLLTIFAIRGSKRNAKSAEKWQTPQPVDQKTDLVQFYHFEQALDEVIECMRKQKIEEKQTEQENLLNESDQARIKRDHDMRQEKLQKQQAANTEQLNREVQLINKVNSIFRERECTFTDAFDEVFDPLSDKNVIKIKQFKELVRTLNLPLTVQDHRILRRIADPLALGKVDLKYFLDRFETPMLRKMRLNKTLDKLATSFYLQNFNLKKAFQLFDVNGDGHINRREFRQGFNTLGLGFSYDEIDDLMRLLNLDEQGNLSYDEFILHMDANIRHRKKDIQNSIETQLFKKVAQCLKHSRESLYSMMKTYDFNDEDSIKKEDMIRVFKRLGISSIEPHLPTIMRVGGVGAKDERIDLISFASRMTTHMRGLIDEKKKAQEDLVCKVHSLLKAKGLTVYDMFVLLDVNKSGGLSKVETSTGIQSLGLTLTREEFDLLWKTYTKIKSEIKVDKAKTTPGQFNMAAKTRASKPTIGYLDLLRTFIKFGCIKIQKTTDRSNTLISKFRQQMKKENLSVDKLYKAYDPQDHRFVFKNEFIEVSHILNFQFSDDEFCKIFEIICATGQKPATGADQQTAATENLAKSNTRFTYKQLHDAILVKRDENWVFQAFIKIHSVVLQKALSYKRLFSQWRDKGSKSGPNRLTQQELSSGLKKMKAGLTHDEIEKLTSQLHFTGKDTAIDATEFQQTVIQGAQKLENEQCFERMLLTDWIVQFNSQMHKNDYPFDKVFSEFDSDHKGGLSFEDFVNFNEYVAVFVSKKDLRRIFDIIDRNKNGVVGMDDIKNVSQLTMAPEDNAEEAPEWQEQSENLTGNEILVQQQLNDLYEELKNKIETKNLTMEAIVFQELKFSATSLATIAGLKQIFEKLQIVVTKEECNRLLKVIRKANFGKFECTYKDFIDFLTKMRVNVAFLEKGFIDPLLAAAVNQLNGLKDQYDLTFMQLFQIMITSDKEDISKEEFVLALQGMEVNSSVEDLNELFNYIDEKGLNRITRQQFVQNMTFVSNKMAGPSLVEQSMAKGIIQAKKGVTNVQLVFKVLNDVCEDIQRKMLNLKQLLNAMDVNKTGFLSKAEFTAFINNLSEKVKLENVRLIHEFFDEKRTGKIQILEFLRVCSEIINTKIGGGVFAQLQVHPIITKVINELAIDCDRFFDEVADLNEQFLANQLRSRKTVDVSPASDKTAKTANKGKGSALNDEILAKSGLSKIVFFNQLQVYGVMLSENEKALLSSVFGLLGPNRDKLNYEAIDIAFEGVQQQLYSQDQQYTVEWERRLFKRIGSYLIKKNISFHECFGMIDTDDSQTVSLVELGRVLAHLDLRIPDKQMQLFLKRLDDKSLGYITQHEFIQRCLSAYTYDDNSEENQQFTATLAAASFSSQVETPQSKFLAHNIQEASRKIKSELDQQVRELRMYKSIQARIKEVMTVQEAFAKLDTQKWGFLTLKDFQTNFSTLFDLSLQKEEMRKLFFEIDSDQNGVVKFQEFEEYYFRDYVKRAHALKKEKEQKNTQNEIFDHLIKVLKQKGLTLKEMFQQIDTDHTNYIDVDEFHDILERMGFTITQEQVYELMCRMDDNFDGRISYHELRSHIETLGFDIAELGENQGGEGDNKEDDYVWRDKAIELLIRTFKHKLGQKKTYAEHLTKYDDDFDGHLTPAQFRRAILDLKEPQLKQSQIERIMHIVIEEKKLKPLIAIERVTHLLQHYSFIELDDGKGSQSVLIDEDLFVYIVEKYDGLSRLLEQIQNLEDRSSYLSRHVSEIELRGLNMLSNQKTIQKIKAKSQNLNDLFESTLILLAGEVTRLIKEEAQLCMLDPTHNINQIVSDNNVGVLTSIPLPTIENSAFDMDFGSVETIPCGAQRFRGNLMPSREPVEVLLYPSDFLQYVSCDGKVYKRHLAMELQVHRYMMGAKFEDDGEKNLAQDEMDIFVNIGKFEKKVGLSTNEKEIYVVNRWINDNEWISLDDFMHLNGGILNIPLFYHTDAPLFIIRHWAKIVLQIIHKVHDVSIVLRCLSTKQLFISRDGQRIKLGHTRGIGKVNNLGQVSSCPDIYLNLDNNQEQANNQKSQTFANSSGQKSGGGLSSSHKTDGQRKFTNQCLDNPFVAPEMLFSKFQEHTAALDVWGFGMVMFCVLFGRKPVSYYNVYRKWFLKSHNHDVEISTLPFLPPSRANFIYDPFSVDFENPFDMTDFDLIADQMATTAMAEEDVDVSFNFSNFMKSIENLSYSSMFSHENSKKFNFSSIADEIKSQNTADLEKVQPARFAGQQGSQKSVRQKTYMALAKSQVLGRKNELGLILDLIASCLDVDPKKRPTIQGLLNAPIFQMDSYEKTNAVRFSQNVILYRSPQSSVSLRITEPLRRICADAIKNPFTLFERQEHIMTLFHYTDDCIAHITSIPLEDINDVLTDEERRKGLISSAVKRNFAGKDFSQLRVSPNSPLAAQIIDDKVIDMLLFINFRYMKHFETYKQKQLQQLKAFASVVEHGSSKAGGTDKASTTHHKTEKSVKFAETEYDGGEGLNQNSGQASRAEILKAQTQRLQNHVLSRTTHLLRTLVYEMHSYNTPLSPFAAEIIEFIVKFFVGEESVLGSDSVLRKTSNADVSLKDFLRTRSFFRRESEYNADFKSDLADKLWHLEQKNKVFLDKSSYWCHDLHREALKLYKDAITESGIGNSCYPVINDYIQNVSNSFEPSKIFSKQMNHLSVSFLIPMNRTSAYYNEMIPLTESLSRLFNPDLEKAGKRCSLAMIRSVFQTGNSDKIKACLDMRVPKHIIHFLQDSDPEVRRETLLTFYEISKGLQDDDFEIIGRHAVNIKQDFSKQGYKKTAFDKHKAVSMASQQEVLDAKDPNEANPRRGRQSKQTPPQNATDAMCNYIKRTIALIEKNENEKYVNFALDLPNLNFLACKRFLREMAVCFESPVFIAPLVRLLKTPDEAHHNKLIILDLMKNLICGSEKVLIAINSPACDTYMTLLKLLIKDSKLAGQKSTSSNMNVQTRSKLELQEKAIELFEYIFEQRRPAIIRDISCIGASATLLKEQDLRIPKMINLPDIVGFFDEVSAKSSLTPASVNFEEYLGKIKDLRCWVKHFYAQSTIPELTRIKALQRCCNFLIRFCQVLWKDYFRDTEESAFGMKSADNFEKKQEFEKSEAQRKANNMVIFRASVSLIDWLCVVDKFIFIFNEECGRTNLAFVIDTCNKILTQFRKPKGANSKMAPMEDLTFNAKENKKVQETRKYDIFPFTEVGAIMQNIEYQLVRKNDAFLNQLLSEANFGFVFGEQLLVEYDFMRHCIDNCVESLVLMDSYVKKNEIRLNTFEYLLRSHEHTLKDQFIKSNFCERLFLDFVQDFREFNIQFSKIDLEFLAFRRSYPIRLESISLLNTALMMKANAPQVYTEIIMYARRHFMVRNELNLLKAGKMSNREATSLLLFAIILESNEEDLIYVMVQEGVHRVIREQMKEYPSLNKRFPILANFINKF